YKSNFFEDMDFRYMGPIDGHDIHTLTEALEGAKIVNGPVLLHVKTIKGKGYNPAEQMPSQFHGCPKFDPETGEFSSKCDSFSNKFGEFLRLQAAKDKRICAITAAMSLGTGLKGFSEEYPDRFFDVGIAEEHALPYALGLSESGMLPVFVVYSTFLQRCFDQIIHDAALQNRKIIIAVDRAGITGDDGETHQGIYDVSLLNGIPNITVFAPTYFSQLNGFLVQALYHTNGVIAVRYPRGCEPNLPDEYTPTTENYETYLKKDSEVAIVTYGRLFPYACDAAKRLRKKGISGCVIKLNRIKPIDEEAIKECLSLKEVYFFEEGIKSGGAGESFSRMLLEWEYKGKFTLRAFDNCFVEHGNVENQLHKYGLDADGMYSLIKQDGGNADE
ncbi:MAG TPA: transketolase C-terminal domain-containing protein, partial [Clostridia bacterium]|nr:transketolase C-terminal domain-containing protein [Clostridia bacterium]